MKRRPILNAVSILCVSLALSATLSWSAPEQKTSYVSQIFSVENMTCATCPIIVSKAMSSVEGVESVEVNYEAKRVRATYDPSLVKAASIAQASTEVGFPAKVYSEAP